MGPEKHKHATPALRIEGLYATFCIKLYVSTIKKVIAAPYCFTLPTAVCPKKLLHIQRPSATNMQQTGALALLF
jgi:hypothetical protein